MEFAAPSVVADTHALVWYLLDPASLSTPATAALEAAASGDGSIVVPSVSLIEIVYLAEKPSRGISATDRDDLIAAMEAAGSPFELIGVTLEIARAATAIDRASVADPFDRTILATSVALGLPLVSKDQRLHAAAPSSVVW